MTVDVAVIPTAGRGTRMLPATRSVPKALLPVVDRPAIQWVVEEGMRAGVREFVIVVNPEVDHLLAGHFAGSGDFGVLEGFEDVRIETVVQREPLGLGHAVLEARDVVAGRHFYCLLGDNIAVPGRDQLAPMGEASDGRSVILLRELDDELLDKYGVIVPGERFGDRVVEMLGAIEKPGREHAPSRLGLVGRYLFDPEVFDRLAGQEPGYGGEIQLTDAIDAVARDGRCLGYVGDADLLDVGTPATYLEAIAELGLWHPDLRDRWRSFLDGLVHLA